MKLKFKLIALTFAFFFNSALIFAAEAKVISVKGKCEYEKNGVWTAITEGQILSEGTKIQTGFKSELVISLKSSNEDSTMTVAQLSRLTIEQLISSEKMDKTNVYMDTGSVKSAINKTSDKKVNFTIRSAVATASVRGTIVTSTVTVNGTLIETDRGDVAVWETGSADAENLMNADEEIRFPKNFNSVKQFQGMELNRFGKNKTPMENASERANNLTTMRTPAENEINSFRNGPAPDDKFEKPETGIMTVSVKWAD